MFCVEHASPSAGLRSRRHQCRQISAVLIGDRAVASAIPAVKCLSVVVVQHVLWSGALCESFHTDFPRNASPYDWCL